jgi:hypothetical protein
LKVLWCVTPGGRSPTEVTHQRRRAPARGRAVWRSWVGTKSYDTGRVADPSGTEQLYRLTSELHERGVLAVGGTRFARLARRRKRDSVCLQLQPPASTRLRSTICVSAPKRDPTPNVKEGIGNACRIGRVMGSRSTPIGPPPWAIPAVISKWYTPFRRGPGCAPIYSESPTGYSGWPDVVIRSSRRRQL